MSSGSFFFDKKVGMLAEPCEPMPYVEKPRVRMSMVQNGFEIHYGEQEFIAETLDKALEMVKSWFEDAIKEAEKSDKK